MAFVSRTTIGIFIALFLCPGLTLATDDAYLKMLEGEAEGVELDQRGQLKDKEHINDSTDGITKTNWKWEGDLAGDILPADLQQSEFATLLKQQFYGTFVFYRRLNSVDQDTVFLHYSQAKNADLDSIRQEIMNLIKR